MLLLVSVPVEAGKAGVAEPLPEEMGGAASAGMVMADALNCQKKAAKAVVDGKVDCLLIVKGNMRDWSRI